MSIAQTINITNLSTKSWKYIYYLSTIRLQHHKPTSVHGYAETNHLDKNHSSLVFNLGVSSDSSPVNRRPPAPPLWSLCTNSIHRTGCTSIAARVHETSSLRGRLIAKYYAHINSNIPLVVSTQVIIINLNPFIPHNAFKHHFASLKNDWMNESFPKSRVLERKFPGTYFISIITIHFFHFSPTSSHLHPLQAENCDSNSQAVCSWWRLQS